MKYFIKIKSFSSDLKTKFPDGHWITSNGSRIFITAGKGGKAKVVAGLGGFNGMIDNYFKEEKEKQEKTKESKPETKTDNKKSLYNRIKAGEEITLKDVYGKEFQAKYVIDKTGIVTGLEFYRDGKKFKNVAMKDIEIKDYLEQFETQTESPIYKKYKGLKDLLSLSKYAGYDEEKLLQTVQKYENEGKTKEKIQGIIDYTINSLKQKYSSKIEAEKIKQTLSKDFNKDNIFDLNERIDALTRSGVYGSKNSKELTDLKDYRNENYEKLVLNLLENDLPNKIPKNRDKLFLSNYKGEINVRPIDSKIKAQSPQKALYNNSYKESDLRPEIMGVFHDAENQNLVATDGHQLVIIPQKIEGDSKILLNDGKEVKKRFPTYKQVIPDSYETSIETKDLHDILNQLNGLERAKKFINSYLGILAKINNSYFETNRIKSALQTLAETGTKGVKIEFQKDVNEGVVFRDIDNPQKLAVVMPIKNRDWHDKIEIPYKTLDIKGKVQERKQGKDDFLDFKNKQ